MVKNLKLAISSSAGLKVSQKPGSLSVIVGAEIFLYIHFAAFYDVNEVEY